MARCILCNSTSPVIAGELGVCLACIREKPGEALPVAARVHERSRRVFGLPVKPPKEPDGVLCNLCVNECRIPVDGTGYCGVRKNDGGIIKGVSPDQGKLSWYHDPLPTNCVGDWICPGGTGAGYPRYAYCPGPEWGYKNLAVFFHACSFNCLFCQNWHFKEHTLEPRTASVRSFVSSVDEKTSCICYFGGDPSPQLPYSLNASRIAIDQHRERILRICWETNGAMHPNLCDEIREIALRSGGCIKFDLKARDENLHMALTGVTNRRTMENFERVGHRIKARPIPPLLIASTLLVPGYIDEEEIRGVAKFIAGVNLDIPYSILAFHPHFYMSDLPRPSKALANRCVRAARDEGLTNVRLGNVHLLV
jgi:pyruvate formate lyase activating enzyme